MSYSDLFIADNSESEMQVKKYLREWCGISKQMDIATGYFEIGSLLELDGDWQKLDKIRILFGDEVTRRTKNIFEKVLDNVKNKLDDSVEVQKEVDEFLTGVFGIVQAIKNGKIECKVYKEGKFHAKSYITYFKDDFHEKLNPVLNVPKGYALVGSSNFTAAGLTENIELNVQIKNDVDKLQEWFNKYWEISEDVTLELLNVIEKHVREYTPFEVYLKSLHEFCDKHDKTIGEWEINDSVMYQLLSQYQKDGYNSLVAIAERYSGAFLCDGVGLGKTFVGMMLIERFVKKERKNVVLIVPASARIAVWEATIKRYLPDILDGFFRFKIINHTDLQSRESSKINLLNQIKDQAEVIIIDEAHHFRTPDSKKYKKLLEIMGNGCKKELFMLTATPINNSFLDLQHLIELFTLKDDKYFSSAPLGIPSLTGHIRKMELELDNMTATQKCFANDYTKETENIFIENKLINALVVQRSRAYVKKSLSSSDVEISFPIRQSPFVKNYSLKKVYGNLIDDFIESFYHKDKSGNIRPILYLSIYSPYEEEYFKGDINSIEWDKRGRQAQVVNLIRQLLLKRFESSPAAFEETCIRIYSRLKKFVDEYVNFGNERAIRKFFERNETTCQYIENYVKDHFGSVGEFEEEFPDYVWNTEDALSIDDFNLDVMLEDTINDLEILCKFVDELRKISSNNDDKITQLKDILFNDSNLIGKKVIIFTEYRTTAKYIESQLKDIGLPTLYEIDGQTKELKTDIIERFAPYYNGKSSSEIKNEIQILISTDVLAEGLNLQDATCLINYDIHWNPVRLMQRIGRVDRRRSSEIEDKICHDHPEIVADRQNIYYWNFLPPDELDSLLDLYGKVARKTLRISKVFGIEGRKLLTPDDDYDALQDFNSAYDGKETKMEEIYLEYQKLIAGNPKYMDFIIKLPKKIYSGKMSESRNSSIFFCYRLPSKLPDGNWTDTEIEGICSWYLYNCETGEISSNIYDIWKKIKTDVETPRTVSITANEFSIAKKKMREYIKAEYMRKVQAPAGYNPKLISWIQLI